uniref:Uncharacterized protein n=1 Tax=Neolamprologus brichardi TaxID=32507 RepID=A0A3Q4N5H6_NEOBR
HLLDALSRELFSRCGICKLKHTCVSFFPSFCCFIRRTEPLRRLERRKRITSVGAREVVMGREGYGARNFRSKNIILTLQQTVMWLQTSLKGPQIRRTVTPKYRTEP